MEEYPPRICEDEIDLRELVLTVWSGKWIILAATLLAALAAFSVSLAQPKQYEAQASVILMQPKMRFVTQEGLSLQPNVPDLKTAAAEARSSAIFQRLAAEDAAVQAAWSQEDAPLTWQSLAGHAGVKEQGKNGLQLLFKDTDPQRSALVVNHWAALVVENINEYYGWAGVSAQLDSQAQSAWRAYQAAQSNYLQAAGQSNVPVLQVQVKGVKSDLACTLAFAGELKRLQDDLGSFKGHLDALDQKASLSPGDAAALVALQRRALAPTGCISDTEKVQIEWPVDSLTALTVAQAKDSVEQLISVIQQRSQALPAQQNVLEAEVSRLDQSLEEEQAQLQEARQRRDAAWQIYQSLTIRRAEGQVLDSPENQVALVAAQAVAPTYPVFPRLMMNTILAGILGLMVGSVGVFGHFWWRKNISGGNANKKMEGSDL